MFLLRRYKKWLVLALVLLPSLLPWLMHPVPALKLEDFGVYYTAARLARAHQGAAIYSGADTGQDPQLMFADRATTFARTARSEGLPQVRLYVYPPILADALIPLTVRSVGTADRVWTWMNYAALAAVALLTANLAGLRFRSPWTAVILVALLAAQPVVSCLTWGQVTVFLLLLWVLGAWCYKRGWLAASAFVLALATAIKLTPLIVIVPFLLWREWRWLRSYVVSLGVLAAAMCVFNSPSTLKDYFFHVMPSMSQGVPSKSNESILASVQMLYVALKGGVVYPISMLIPHPVITLGKLISLLAVLVSVIFAYRAGEALPIKARLMMVALFAMLSAPVSPVSWPHSYAVSLAALVLLWSEALREPVGSLRFGLLALGTLAINSYVFQYAMTYLVNHTRHEVAIGMLALVTPAAVILLVWTRLLAMQPAKERSVVEEEVLLPRAA